MLRGVPDSTPAWALRSPQAYKSQDSGNAATRDEPGGPGLNQVQEPERAAAASRLAPQCSLGSESAMGASGQPLRPSLPLLQRYPSRRRRAHPVPAMRPSRCSAIEPPGLANGPTEPRATATSLHGPSDPSAPEVSEPVSTGLP